MPLPAILSELMVAGKRANENSFYLTHLPVSTPTYLRFHSLPANLFVEVHDRLTHPRPEIRMPEPMRPFKYVVVVGDPRDHEMTTEFNWDEQAPVSLLDEVKATDFQGFAARTTFRKHLTAKHALDILQDGAMSCVVCKERAHALVYVGGEGEVTTKVLPGEYHSHFAFAAPAKADRGRGAAGKEPTIIDYAAPVCVSTGACYAEAGTALRTLLAGAPGIVDIVRDWRKSCAAACGSVEGVKACTGCKTAA